MGLFNLFKNQLINLIQWDESENGVLAYRYQMKGQEIKNGAQLTVQDSQLALVVKEGKIADLFEPGLHVLQTKNLPILTSLNHWDTGFKSPFKTDVYFFSTREQINQRWGTSNPIVIKDKDHGVLRIRSHGTYSYKIKNPVVFFTKVSGTKDKYLSSDLEGQLRSAILTHIADSLAETEISFVNMAANQIEFSELLKKNLLPLFSGYGLHLEKFFIQSLTLPEELQTIVDAKSNNKDDTLNKIERLHELFKKGVLTQQEFELKKSELLKGVV